MSAFLPADAAQKICPNMLVFLSSFSSEPTPDCMCRGPCCAAWRWADPSADELRRRGYCGLGGALGATP
jgi:hypothetical protein